ncbi:MAG: hypothetical protein K5851_08255 [Lachnospiraceae bacterium]|nr:hypothetical protein [Lachnospiraceae bacterium]
MSQEKVERKKEQKLNMKKDVKQRKIKSRIAKILVAIVCVVALGWIVVSVDSRYTDYRIANHKTIKADISDLANFSLD